MTFSLATEEVKMSVTTDDNYFITKTPKEYRDFVGQKIAILTKVLRSQAGFSWKRIK